MRPSTTAPWIWLPLVALTLVADAESEGDRTVRLLSLARDLAGVREADHEAGTTARLLEALEKIRDEVGEVLMPTKLVHALKACPGWAWLKRTRRLAGLLNPLGLFRQQRREGERRKRCYVLAQDTLADLRARYGAPAEAVPEA